jgi:hypothetical protein
MATNPENELRAMIGDLFMQIAVLRAELGNLKERHPEPEPELPVPPEEKVRSNGKSEGHRP